MMKSKLNPAEFEIVADPGPLVKANVTIDLEASCSLLDVAQSWKWT